MIPSKRFRIGSENSRARDGEILCRVNREIKIAPTVLSAYCFRELTDTIYDLMLLAAGVAYCDRSLSRRPATTWRRQLHLVVPVADPDLWMSKAVMRSLVQTLGLLTGDEWSISFVKRQWDLPNTQSPLGLGHGDVKVMPYSGGLDSTMIARTLASKGQNLILVTAGRKPDADRKWRSEPDGRRRFISVPFHFSESEDGNRLRETSYRSRGFVFCVMGGIAAFLSGCDEVVMPESGQGALGLWLAPVGNEAPDVRSNPIFTHQLSGFLKELLGRSISYEYPALWKTKGETLSELQRSGKHGEWWKARSCARDGRSVGNGGPLPQCGICSACLLRRQSLLKAGLDEAKDHYLWSDLSGSTVEEALAQGSKSPAKNDTRYAICGALSLEHIARLHREHDLIRRKAMVLSPFVDLTPKEVEEKLHNLLKTHSEEWRSFVNHQGSNSYLRSVFENDGQ